jgi:hypothetical protein
MYVKTISTILFILAFNIIGYGQTFSYSYTDPCTGVLKSIQVPTNGITVNYYGEIQTFQPADFYSGAFETWTQNVYANYGGDNPCATIVGLSSSVNIAQNTAINFIGIVNSLSALSDMASSAGSTNILSGVGSVQNSSSNGGNKKDKNNSPQQPNNSGSSQPNNGGQASQGSTGNGTSGTQGSGQTSTGSQNQGTNNGNSSNNNGSSNTSGNNNTGGNSANSGNTQSSGQTSSGGSSSTGGSQTTGQTSSGGSSSTEGGASSGSQTSTQSGASNAGSNNTNGSGGSTEGGNGNGQSTPTTEKPAESGGKTNIVGGSVASVQNSTDNGGSGAPSNKNGNRPTILASSDFVGFNFRDSDVTAGGKVTGGYTSMRWDGARSWGINADYTTAIKGPNITGFYAFIKKKRIDLISGTVTLGFDRRSSLYGTLALGQMWNLGKKGKFKAVYMLTGSYGNVYGEEFIGTAAIAGTMYDFKISKRIDIKLLGLYVYAPYVSYYNDILLKSPHVVLPIVGTNVSLSKRFKLNVNCGGAWALNENALNYTIMLGTRMLL